MQKTTTTIELDDLSIDTPYLTIDGNLRITIETETAPPLMMAGFDTGSQKDITAVQVTTPPTQLTWMDENGRTHAITTEQVKRGLKLLTKEQWETMLNLPRTARPARPDPQFKSEEEIQEARKARMVETIKATLWKILEARKECQRPFCEDCDGDKPFAPLLSAWRTRLLERATKLKNPEDKAPLLETAKQIDGHLNAMGMKYGQLKVRDALPFLNIQAAQLIDRISAVWEKAPTPVAP